MIKNINLGINKMTSKQSDIKNKYLKYKQKYLDLKQLIGGRGYLNRILVFTDIGEECDDEGALYLLFKNMISDINLHADIVLCTGNTENRYKRFYYIFHDDPSYKIVQGRVNIYKLVDTDREVGYFPDNSPFNNEFDIFKNNKPLNLFAPSKANLYDIILQISPFASKGDLIRLDDQKVIQINNILDDINIQDNCILVIVGLKEKSTNYPDDEKIHKRFETKIIAKSRGVKVVHVTKYITWTEHYVNILMKDNERVQEAIKDNEYKKVIGRIQPGVALSNTQFNVNCVVNYNIIDKIYNTFIKYINENNLQESYDRAKEHFDNIVNKDNMMRISINDNYMKQSPEIKYKDKTSAKEYSDKTPEKYKDMKLDNNEYDNDYNNIMLNCVFDMTQKLIMMWLIVQFINNAECIIEKDTFTEYIKNLNHLTFPNIQKDITNKDITNEDALNLINIIRTGSINSPQYDCCGMVQALRFIYDPRVEERQKMIENINTSLTHTILEMAYNGKLKDEKSEVIKLEKKRLDLLEEDNNKREAAIILEETERLQDKSEDEQQREQYKTEDEQQIINLEKTLKEIYK